MINFLSNIFKRKRKYRVILKSGASFVIKASELSISFNTGTMQLTKYQFMNPSGETPFHCSPLEISAIIELS